MNFNPQQLMRQAQEMQAKIQKMQGEIAKMEFEASSGGGAIGAKVSGENRLLSIKISPDVIKDGDAEMLEDLVVAAVNAALDKSKEHASQKLSGVTAGLGMPGLL